MREIVKCCWLSLLLLLHFNPEYVSCKKNPEAVWPYDDSIPFPYPTPGPLNIITSSAIKPVITPEPLTFIFKSGPKPVTLKNTGKTLVLLAHDPLLETITGGVLFNDTYCVFETEFHWSSSPNAKALVSVNGLGAPIQAALRGYNSKYETLRKAMNKRDGIVEIIFSIFVGSHPNFLFPPFQSAMRKVLKAKSMIDLPYFFANDWYSIPSNTRYYFTYPGEYIDYVSGKSYDSATIIFPVRSPIPFISFSQFNSTFLSVRNVVGKTYSHSLNTVPRNGRPIGVASGVTSKKG